MVVIEGCAATAEAESVRAQMKTPGEVCVKQIHHWQSISKIYRDVLEYLGGERGRVWSKLNGSTALYNPGFSTENLFF